MWAVYDGEDPLGLSRRTNSEARLVHIEHLRGRIRMQGHDGPNFSKPGSELLWGLSFEPLSVQSPRPHARNPGVTGPEALHPIMTEFRDSGTLGGWCQGRSITDEVDGDVNDGCRWGGDGP